MTKYHNDRDYTITPAASKDAAKGFDEEEPRHPFLVTLHEPDDPDYIVRIDAFDALEALAKVTNVLCRPRRGLPLSRLTITAATEDGRMLDPVCARCRRAGAPLKQVSETSFFCPPCLDIALNAMVVAGELDAHVREDGKVEYRATSLLLDGQEDGG